MFNVLGDDMNVLKLESMYSTEMTSTVKNI